jgi:hypothetical protein
MKGTMKFIRLSSTLINPSAIRAIAFTETKYILQFTAERISGGIFLGSGGIDSGHLQLVIDKKEHPSDYRVMERWISKNEHY